MQQSMTGTPRHRRPKKQRKRAKISLTPLVDVVFILVIFFMLASTFIRTNSVELVTPKAGGGQSASTEQSLSVTILGDDRFELNGAALDGVALGVSLADQSDERVSVRSGPEAELQDVVSFLDLASKLGLTNLSFLSDPKPSDREQ